MAFRLAGIARIFALLRTVLAVVHNLLTNFRASNTIDFVASDQQLCALAEQSSVPVLMTVSLSITESVAVSRGQSTTAVRVGVLVPIQRIMSQQRGVVAVLLGDGTSLRPIVVVRQHSVQHLTGSEHYLHLGREGVVVTDVGPAAVLDGRILFGLAVTSAGNLPAQALIYPILDALLLALLDKADANILECTQRVAVFTSDTQLGVVEGRIALVVPVIRFVLLVIALARVVAAARIISARIVVASTRSTAVIAVLLATIGLALTVAAGIVAVLAVLLLAVISAVFLLAIVVAVIVIITVITAAVVAVALLVAAVPAVVLLFLLMAAIVVIRFVVLTAQLVLALTEVTGLFTAAVRSLAASALKLAFIFTVVAIIGIGALIKALPAPRITTVPGEQTAIGQQESKHKLVFRVQNEKVSVTDAILEAQVADTVQIAIGWATGISLGRQFSTETGGVAVPNFINTLVTKFILEMSLGREIVASELMGIDQ